MITNLLKKSLVVFNSAPVASTDKAPCYAGFICTKSAVFDENGQVEDGQIAVWKGFERIMLLVIFMFLSSPITFGQGWVRQMGYDGINTSIVTARGMLGDTIVLSGTMYLDDNSWGNGIAQVNVIDADVIFKKKHVWCI